MLSREVRIGLTVLAGIVIIYLTIAWARRIHFFAPDVHTYTIVFDTVNGLLEGDQIKVRGYPAGRVEQIIPSNDHVNVDISLDQTIVLYQDAQAEIQVKELMGGKHISLQTGRRGEVLPVGGTIQGRTSLDFSTSFSQVGQLLGEVDKQALDDVSRRLDRISVQLEAILLNLDPEAPGRIIASLDRSTARLEDLLAPANAERVDQTWRQADQLLTQTQTSLKRIDDLLATAERDALPKADTLLDQLASTLSVVNQLATDAQAAMEIVNDEETVLGKVLHDPSLATQLDTILTNINQTLIQIQERKIIVGFRLKKGK